MSMISINGVGLPPPTTLKIGLQDLDSPDSTRNERGYLQRDRIRQGMYRIELSFDVKTATEIALIESVLVDASLTVSFPDAGGRKTRTMYVGDRNKEMVLNNPVPSKARWSLSFNLIEY